MSSAASRVFSTYELLEQVLSNVPVTDLFVAQRVNKAWLGIMQRSEALRKKMFLLADGDVVKPSPHDTDPGSRNGLGKPPLYDQPLHLCPAVRMICGDCRSRFWGHGGFWPGGFNLHPEDKNEAGRAEVLARSGYRRNQVLILMTHVVTRVAMLRGGLEGTGPNVSKMLLVQPPITTVGLPFPRGPFSDAETRWKYITNPAGITLGDVQTAIGTVEFHSMQLGAPSRVLVREDGPERCETCWGIKHGMVTCVDIDDSDPEDEGDLDWEASRGL